MTDQSGAERRRFGRTERAVLFVAADGRCQEPGCGAPLGPGWHADHIDPYSRGGPTHVTNGRALCAKCNLKKGIRVSRKLRRWQERAVTKYFAAGKQHWLQVANPGAGKTVLAIEIARETLRLGRASFLVIVVPAKPLCFQWADEFNTVGIDVDPHWNLGAGIKDDMHGVVITYQALANPAMAMRLAHETTQRPTLVVLDEIHHLAHTDDEGGPVWEKRAWEAFQGAAWELGMSGTPFRTDNHEIPFVTYQDGSAVPDDYYGYAEALADRDDDRPVDRRIYFPRIGGTMEWSWHDDLYKIEIENAKGDRRALRTAVMPEGEWMATAIDQAHAELLRLREDDPDAGGIIFAAPTPAGEPDRYVHRLARVLAARTGLADSDIAVVTQDVAKPHELLTRFREGKQFWLVAVRMVTEGIDLPRLRVGLWATFEKTELMFRQNVFRCGRTESDHEDHTAAIYLPHDADLVEWAAELVKERNHVLAEDDKRQRGPICGPGGNGEPRSPFRPVRSTGTLTGTIVDAETYTAAELAHAERLKQSHPAMTHMRPEDIAMVMRANGSADKEPFAEPNDGHNTARSPKYKRKDQLRKANHKMVGKLCYAHPSLDHGQVNMRLNRTVGISAVDADEATEDKLQQRLTAVELWYATGGDEHLAGW
jgi:superfamily II DNA or RNA helicase